MGRGYVIDHVISVLQVQTQEEIYRTYITDALNAIVHNTSGQEDRKTLQKRYHDIIHHDIIETSDEDDVDVDQKAKDIINKIKNKLKGG